MLSNRVSAVLARRNVHYAWVMVGVTFFAALVSAGTVGAIQIPELSFSG